MNPAFFPFFPDLQDDSYATIGWTVLQMVPQATKIHPLWKMLLSPNVEWLFRSWRHEQSLNVNTLTGASWYVLNTAANALPDADGRWLVAQITTTGSISGRSTPKFSRLGVGADQVQSGWDFDGPGEFPLIVTLWMHGLDGMQLQRRSQQRRRFLCSTTNAACVVVTASPKATD